MSAITLRNYSRLVKKAQAPKYLVLSAVKEAAEENIQARQENKASYLVGGEFLFMLQSASEKVRYNVIAMNSCQILRVAVGGHR